MKKARAALIEDLKQQLRDLTFAVEAKRKLAKQMDASEVQGSVSLVTGAARSKKGRK